MQYVRICYDNGYAGCCDEHYLAFDDECTEEYINGFVSEGLYDYAESYSHVASGWEGFENEEDEEYYYENCYYDWEFISKEEWEENEGTNA